MPNGLDVANKLLGVIPGFIGFVIWVTHGLQRIVGDNPVSYWLNSQSFGLLVIAGVPILFSTISVGAGVWASRWHASRGVVGRLYTPLLAGTSTLSMVSTLALIGVLLTIVQHPAWCPHTLCPEPTGPHDQFLEAEFTSLQSETYVIPGDPAQYSLKQLPVSSGVRAIAAHRTRLVEKSGTKESPYRLALRLHSLQRNGAGMFIEEIGVLIHDAQRAPSPLRVWVKGAPLDYEANPYELIYIGQTPGTTVSARYVGAVPDAHVQLAPGESDEVTLTVTSAVAVDLKFKVDIAYRVGDHLKVRTLELPYLFEVVFSDALNWNEYQLQNGQFKPS